MWQVLQQFPCSFEFNERFLITILDHLYSCQFGTFLCDTEKQRRDLKLREKTTSLWSYTNDEAIRKDFINPFYMPDPSVLLPDLCMHNFALWRGYYLRYFAQPTQCKLTPQLRVLQLQSIIAGMKEQIVRLENYVERTKRNRSASQESVASAAEEDNSNNGSIIRKSFNRSPEGMASNNNGSMGEEEDEEERMSSCLYETDPNKVMTVSDN